MKTCYNRQKVITFSLNNVNYDKKKLVSNADHIITANADVIAWLKVTINRKKQLSFSKKQL